MASSILPHALAYARRGFRVFPLVRGVKKPPMGFFGFFDQATTDENVIREWFEGQYRNCDAAMLTGEDYFVVDADVKEGVPGLQSFDEMRSLGPDFELIVATPSGGRHGVVRKPRDVHVPSCIKGLKDYPGVDIKGWHGYVAIPGSIGKNGKPYTIIKDGTPIESPTLIELVGRAAPPPDRATQLAPVCELDLPGNIEHARNYLRQEAATATEDVDGNPATYDTALWLRDFGISEDMCACLMDPEEGWSWNQKKAFPSWPPDKLGDIIGNAYRYGKKPPGWRSAESEFDVVETVAPPKELAASAIPTLDSLAISEEEMAAAELTPRCIVQDYLYCDISVLVGVGGVSKTTLILYEAIHLVLGRELWGLEVKTVGRVLVVTAEDPRERLVARLRMMMDAMGLSDEERAIVRRNVVTWDVTSSNPRLKLASMKNGMLSPAKIVSDIAAAYKGDPPIMVVFDPLVSFGVAENMVNDNEQALIDAGRVLIGQLGCCVRFVHHTGKQGGQIKKVEEMHQYMGRNGSALPDGARMVAVLASFDAKSAAPPGFPISEGQDLVVLARPKVSFAPPRRPTIYLRRRGFVFDYYSGRAADPAATAERSLLAAMRTLTGRNQEMGPNSRAGNYVVRAVMRLQECQGLDQNAIEVALEALQRAKKVWLVERKKRNGELKQVFEITGEEEPFEAPEDDI